MIEECLADIVEGFVLDIVKCHLEDIVKEEMEAEMLRCSDRTINHDTCDLCRMSAKQDISESSQPLASESSSLSSLSPTDDPHGYHLRMNQ